MLHAGSTNKCKQDRCAPVVVAAAHSQRLSGAQSDQAYGVLVDEQADAGKLQALGRGVGEHVDGQARSGVGGQAGGGAALQQPGVMHRRQERRLHVQLT